MPYLTTALTGPLQEIERSILNAQGTIEHWLRSQWKKTPPPFYASVDLRNAGFKLAPVDTNLFPGGFNNLNEEAITLGVHAATVAVEKICSEARGALLIPENHTRNQFYLQNVWSIATILRQAGLEVHVGSLQPELVEPMRLAVGEATLVIEPLSRSSNRLKILGATRETDFDPCMVILNNDLSAGAPALLQGIEQPMLPPPFAGWATRRKTKHFSAYNQVAEEFSQLLGIDPWLITPYFSQVSGVDFQDRLGEQALADHVSTLLEQIRRQYQRYNISAVPYVVVKADAGTYGMGVMTVKDASEVIGLNRKQRNKMAVGKEGLAFHDVIIQEGVYTFETVEEAVAEPVVYMIDRYVIGGFYRVHTDRGVDENLNAPGMHFVPLAFEKPCSIPDARRSPDCAPNRFYSYGVVARLALLAAAIELKQMEAELPDSHPS